MDVEGFVLVALGFHHAKKVWADKRWVDEVLSRGGSRDALDNFKAFRGREPSADALLRHSGIA